jgi:hypothetical protein
MGGLNLIRIKREQVGDLRSESGERKVVLWMRLEVRVFCGSFYMLCRGVCGIYSLQACFGVFGGCYL